MNIKIFKKYLSFIITAFLFVISIGYSLQLYFSWDDPLSADKAAPLEINLPIIDWNGYLSLSKQYQDDTLKDN